MRVEVRWFHDYLFRHRASVQWRRFVLVSFGWTRHRPSGMIWLHVALLGVHLRVTREPAEGLDVNKEED